MSSSAHFQQTLLEELATVLGSLLSRPATTTAGAHGEPLAWRVQVTVGGSWAGSVTLAFAASDVARLSQLVMGLEAPGDDAAVADLLLEATNQALGALVVRPEFSGVMAQAAAPVREVSPGELDEATPLRAELGEAGVTMACLAHVEPAAAAPRTTAPALATGAAAAPAQESGPGYPANLDVILDIDLPLTVRFGETEMTLDALTRLGPGSVIDLVRSPDEPVDVLVNGRLVARGEVVVVSGNYGVRVSEVVSAADRLRSMSA